MDFKRDSSSANAEQSKPTLLADSVDSLRKGAKISNKIHFLGFNKCLECKFIRAIRWQLSLENLASHFRVCRESPTKKAVLESWNPRTLRPIILIKCDLSFSKAKAHTPNCRFPFIRAIRKGIRDRGSEEGQILIYQFRCSVLSVLSYIFLGVTKPIHRMVSTGIQILRYAAAFAFQKNITARLYSRDSTRNSSLCLFNEESRESRDFQKHQSSSGRRQDNCATKRIVQN